MIDSFLSKKNNNTYQFTGTQFIFTDKIKELLLKTATKSEKKTSRICLHASEDDTTQNMIICILPFQEFPAHKHPKGKSESYTVIDGKLYVEKYDNSLKLNETIVLSSYSGTYLHAGETIHKPYTKSEYCIYQEVYHGTFNRNYDVQLINLKS